MNAPNSTKVLSIPAGTLRPFEPVGLGAYSVEFRRLAESLPGLHQSEIVRRLEGEAERVKADTTTEALAYRLSVLVLRDFVLFGHYPVIAEGRCFLAGILDSPNLTDGRRRAITQRLYETARNRLLAERNAIDGLERTLDALETAGYDAPARVEALRTAPPQVQLLRASTAKNPLDTRSIWKAVRATWSMTPDASAPGRDGDLSRRR